MGLGSGQLLNRPDSENPRVASHAEPQIARSANRYAFKRGMQRLPISGGFSVIHDAHGVAD